MIDKVFSRIKTKSSNPYSDLLPIKPKLKLKKPPKNKFFKKNKNKAPYPVRTNSTTKKTIERVGEHLSASLITNSSMTEVRVGALLKKDSSDFKYQKSNIIITVDNRERNSLVPAELHAKDFNIKFEQLKVGDYLVNDTIIERKEINDLIQSIKNKRIWKQLEEIKQYPNYMLIIEGSIYEQKSLHPNALRGFLLSTATSYKVPIIFVKHPKETVQYIELLANKKSSPISINPTKKQLTHKKRQQYILEAFPNIGPTKAKQLIEKFSSLKNIFNTTEEKLIPILGKKTKPFLNQLL